LNRAGRRIALCASFAASACSAMSGGPARLRAEVIAVYPHDPAAFTQGLLAGADGRLLESTGLYGASGVRAVDLATGAVLDRAKLASNLFGEGLAQVGDKLVLLTWREHRALVVDATTLDLLPFSFSYDTEGWGLCYDGQRLVMSDGSPTLTFRSPHTFERLGSVDVAMGLSYVTHLNELECARGRVYANVWQTETLVEIDPKTGQVTALIDASGLLSSEERAQTDVLNGIAAVPGKDTFLITGKLWPKLFEVRFVPE
jgi:glutaminyl-peptide cyclotransferase